MSRGIHNITKYDEKKRKDSELEVSNSTTMY